MIFFEDSLDTEGVIRNAKKLKIYLDRMMDSLYAIITTPNQANTTEDVLRKYNAFFKVLSKELEVRGIQKVEIGQGFDVTGCEIARTIELTPEGVFTCENDRRETSKLQDIFGNIFPPEHIIGRVVHAIIEQQKKLLEQQNKLLIERLESGIKYVNELISGSTERPESDRSLRPRRPNVHGILTNMSDYTPIEIENSQLVRSIQESMQRPDWFSMQIMEEQETEFEKNQGYICTPDTEDVE